MGFFKTLMTILQIISALIVIILVLLQDSKDDGSIITGSSNNGGSIGASRATKLASLTKTFGIAFIILTIISSTLMIITQ